MRRRPIFSAVDGAFIADLLVQGLGLAAFLLPLIVIGWAFRLLLQRPLQRMPRRLLMVLPALALGAFACSVVHTAPIPLPAGSGGALGWGLLQFLQAAGLGTLELPLAMGAAAVVALLLLSIMGLSWGDWRDVGNGAGRSATRLAAVSGQGAVIGAAAAVGFSQRVVHRWRAARQEAAAAEATPAAVRALGPARPLPWIKPAAGAKPPVPERREPRKFRRRHGRRAVAGCTTAGARALKAAPGRTVRLVMPGTRTLVPGKRAEQERRQATLNLAPNGAPILPPIDLQVKPPAAKNQTIDEEALSKNARMHEAVLEDYGVRGRGIDSGCAPARSSPFTSWSRRRASRHRGVIGLADDIARSMSALSVRVAVVPGHAASSASSCPTSRPRRSTCASCWIRQPTKSTPAGSR